MRPPKDKTFCCNHRCPLNAGCKRYSKYLPSGGVFFTTSGEYDEVTEECPLFVSNGKKIKKQMQDETNKSKI